MNNKFIIKYINDNPFHMYHFNLDGSDRIYKDTYKRARIIKYNYIGILLNKYK